jgi:hypothetical protein
MQLSLKVSDTPIALKRRTIKYYTHHRIQANREEAYYQYHWKGYRWRESTEMSEMVDGRAWDVNQRAEVFNDTGLTTWWTSWVNWGKSLACSLGHNQGWNGQGWSKIRHHIYHRSWPAGTYFMRIWSRLWIKNLNRSSLAMKIVLVRQRLRPQQPKIYTVDTAKGNQTSNVPR